MIEATIVLDGREFTVKLDEQDGHWSASVDGHDVPVDAHRRGDTSLVTAGAAVHRVALADAHVATIDGVAHPFKILSLAGVEGAADPSAGKHGPIKPPMTGRLDSIEVTDGQTVTRGEVLFVLEAMKMRNEIKAPADGVISKVTSKVGEAVDTDDVILVLSAA